MTPRPEEIFRAVRQLALAEERAAFLDDACKDDAALRGRIEALLQADADGNTVRTPPQESGLKATVLNRDASPASTLHAPASEQAGSRIGPYKLLQLLGE